MQESPEFLALHKQRHGNLLHKNGSKIVLQLMHTGRIGHTDNLPEGVSLVGASGIKAAGQIFTDTKGLQDYSSPVFLSNEGIKKVVNGFRIGCQKCYGSWF